MAKPYYYISTLEKALKILDVFDGVRAPLFLTEIAKRAGVGKQDVHRYLMTLKDLGLVSRDAEGRFSIGRKMFELGQQFVAARAGIDQSAEAYLDQLSQRTGCTNQIGILSDGLVTYVLVVPGTMTVQVVARVGHWRYAHASATGKAIMAFDGRPLHEFKLHEDKDGRLKQVTDRTIITYEHLDRELRQTRARGYSISDGESSLEVTAVGAPIVDGRGKVVAGISASFPRHTASESYVAGIAEQVVATARNVSASIQRV